MKKKILGYTLGGIVYFLIRILFEVIFNREINIILTAIEAVIWLIFFTFIMEIIIPKIAKKKSTV
jgi:hypothetical protein